MLTFTIARERVAVLLLAGRDLLRAVEPISAPPLERNHLAVERDKHSELLDVMNAKLNALIEKEAGEGAGQMLPGGVDGGWAVTNAVYDV